MVVYFSGTGNSRYCAQALASHLQDDLLDSAHYIKHQIAAELISGKPWVFVSPTYAWQIPHVFADFIRSGSFSGNEEAYFVMTCGSEIGNAGAELQKLCKESGLRFRGVYQVVMPENYIVMFNAPEEKEAAEIVAAARPSISEAAALIRAGKDFPSSQVTAMDKLKTDKMNWGMYRFFMKAFGFHTTAACTGCGLCAERCVLNNISMKNGKPVWGERCTQCLACICGCPTEAIEYGNKTKGKPRYWSKD